MGQKEVKFGEGQIIFRQGESGGELFFVKEGKIELTVRNDQTNQTAVIAIAEDRSVLGTMSFMEGDPRSATAKALTEVTCVIINESQREKMLDKIPAWFRILVKDLSHNLRSLNQKYIDLKNRFDDLEKRYNSLRKKEGAASEEKKDDPDSSSS